MSLFDVAILGAGPAGAATALAVLRERQARVLLVEATRFEGPRVGESLAPGANALLHRLGVLDAFQAEGHEPCHGNCSAWGSDELGHSDFLMGVHGPGWHLDRARFDAFLAARAAAAGAELRVGLRFVGAVRTTGGFRLSLRSETGEREAVDARFVVDASGAAARFARLQGATRRGLDRLVCFVDFWARDGEASQLTWLEAVEHGWWYAARLPDDRLVTMLATDRETAAGEGFTQAAVRHAALATTRHIAPLLAGGARWLEATARPAPSFELEPIEGDGWLAVGDAASAFDPLSASGLLKALADGLDAGLVLVADLEGRARPSGSYSHQVHRRYEAFVEGRRQFYDRERRWAESGFWSRRRAAS